MQISRLSVPKNTVAEERRIGSESPRVYSVDELQTCNLVKGGPWFEEFSRRAAAPRPQITIDTCSHVSNLGAMQAVAAHIQKNLDRPSGSAYQHESAFVDLLGWELKVTETPLDLMSERPCECYFYVERI